MSKTKLIFTAILITLLLNSSNTVFAASTCVNQQYITDIRVGYVDQNQQGGTDGGSVVYVYFSNGRYLPLNYRYNLNDAPGPSILSVLMSAMFANLKVTVVDHYGDNCDDFDDVKITMGTMGK
jgi:hypothetical protein